MLRTDAHAALVENWMQNSRAAAQGLAREPLSCSYQKIRLICADNMDIIVMLKRDEIEQIER